MDRINSIGTVTVGGIRQWINKNLLGGIPGTQINAVYMNDLQEELVHGFIEAVGSTPTAGVQNQLQGAAALMFAAAPVGTMGNAKMSVPAASATATFTADEIVVAKALGGFAFKVSNFSETINLATTGAGGMDIGAAPASGFVAIYAIYNPQTGTAALLATNATAAVAPSVYGGANMPAGYIYSALVSVWPTTAGGLLVIGLQIDRNISIISQTVITSSSSISPLTAISISSIVPKNARKISGDISGSAYGTGPSIAVNLSSTSYALSYVTFGINGAAAASPFSNMTLEFPQEIYLSSALTGTSPVFSVAISGYEI